MKFGCFIILFRLNDGITVREALMSRAYQAAAAKYGHGGSKYSAQVRTAFLIHLLCFFN